MNINLDSVLNFMKTSWLVPAIILLSAGFFVIKTFNFSFTDHVANRVIQILDAGYSPFGPNGVPTTAPVVAPQPPPVVQPPPQPNTGFPR